MIEEFRYSTTDNEQIFAKCWLCKNEKAVIQIIHGLGEMAEYYEEFAAFANENNFSVYMNEARGHGRTAVPLVQEDIIGAMQSDVKALTDIISEKHSAPIFILAHSLGTEIAQLYLEQYSDKISGAILTGLTSFDDIERLIAAINNEIEQNGIDAPCYDTFLLIFGKVAERFPEKCSVSWVTSDLERAQYYESLPYTNVMYPNRFYKSFLYNAKYIQSKELLQKLPHTLPLLFLSGSDDSVGQYGKYVVKRYNDFVADGFSDINYKVYKGFRHSILQEKERKQVFLHIINWLDSKLS